MIVIVSLFGNQIKIKKILLIIILITLKMKIAQIKKIKKINELEITIRELEEKLEKKKMVVLEKI